MKKNLINMFLFQVFIVFISGCFFTSVTFANAADVNITASRGKFADSVKINWDQISCASRYQILRSNNYEGPYLEKGWIEHYVPATFTDIEAKNGRYYWYKVRPWYWIFPGESTKKVQGWRKPRIVSSDASLLGQLFNLLELLPHYFIIRQNSKICESSLPEPVNVDNLIPSDGEIFNWVKNVCAEEHRRIGSPESKIAIEYIRGELENILGQENVTTDLFDIDFVYDATYHNLEIEAEDGTVNFECFYVKNTGMSEQQPYGGAVTGEMVWAGAGLREDFDALGDISGKIVVAQCEFSSLPVGLLDTMHDGFYYKSDTGNFVNFSTNYPLTAGRSNFPSGDGDIPNDNSAYYLAKSRGAEALVLTMKNFPGDTNEYGGPYDSVLKPMPCLWVSGYKEEEIKTYANSGAIANVTITGSVKPGYGQNIYGILPGKSKETILISSHHDSLFKGATEDGTGVALVLAQAKAWSQVEAELRKKTIIFVIADGHHYDGVGAEFFANVDSLDIVDDIIVDINLEHLASIGVNINAEGELIDAGRPALNFLFITDNPVPIAVTTRMLKNRQPELTMAVQSTLLGDVPPGEAGHYHLVAGMDFIHWIGGPVYLLDGRDVLDKVDDSKLNYVAQCASELVGSYMALPEEYVYYK